MEILDLSASWIVILLAVGVAALTKSVSGLGFPLVAVPVMAPFVGVEHAVVVVAIPNLVSNAWLLREFRRSAPKGASLPLLLACGAVGAVVGTMMLQAADGNVLSLVLGLLVCGYLVLRATVPTFQLRDATIRWSAPGIGLLGGILQGVAGISGPLVGSYIHAWQLRREPFMFAMASVFGLFSLAQIATFLGVGLYTPTRLAQSALALVPTMVVLPLGMLLRRHLDRQKFEKVVLLVMLVMGLRLLASGFGLV